jgi:hypothetical protein
VARRRRACAEGACCTPCRTNTTTVSITVIIIIINIFVVVVVVVVIIGVVVVVVVVAVNTECGGRVVAAAADAPEWRHGRGHFVAHPEKATRSCGGNRY